MTLFQISLEELPPPDGHAPGRDKRCTLQAISIMWHFATQFGSRQRRNLK